MIVSVLFANLKTSHFCLVTLIRGQTGKYSKEKYPKESIQNKNEMQRKS